MIANLVDAKAFVWRVIILLVMMLILIAIVENPRAIQKRFHPPIADPGQDKKESLVVSYNDTASPLSIRPASLNSK